jgi:hypothetical protein
MDYTPHPSFASNQRDEFALCFGIAFDVALGHGKAGMPGKLLHAPKATPCSETLRAARVMRIPVIPAAQSGAKLPPQSERSDAKLCMGNLKSSLLSRVVYMADSPEFSGSPCGSLFLVASKNIELRTPPIKLPGAHSDDAVHPLAVSF